MPSILAIYLLIGCVIGLCVDSALLICVGSLGDLDAYFWVLAAIVLVLFTVAWLPCLILAAVGWALQSLGVI